MSIKAKRSDRIKSDVLVVGIDVAKRSHVAVVRLPDGSFGKPFAFSNDRRGFERLLARVASARCEGGASSPLFALEATGHYGHALQHYLVSRSADVVGINPAHTKRFKEILDGSPEKSDRKDAVLIADLAAQGRGRPLVVPVGVYAELLLTIPEVAPTTVATILGETGDLRDYRSAAALIKLSGLNLYTLSSGRFCGRTRITKRGRPLLRRIVYMAALRMCREGRPLRAFRDRLVDRIAKPQITVACCRKLLRLMYAMVRDGVAYQPGRLAVADPDQAAA